MGTASIFGTGRAPNWGPRRTRLHQNDFPGALGGGARGDGYARTGRATRVHMCSRVAARPTKHVPTAALYSPRATRSSSLSTPPPPCRLRTAAVLLLLVATTPQSMRCRSPLPLRPQRNLECAGSRQFTKVAQEQPIFGRSCRCSQTQSRLRRISSIYQSCPKVANFRCPTLFGGWRTPVRRLWRTLWRRCSQRAAHHASAAQP